MNDSKADSIQLQILKAMSAEAKLNAAWVLYQTARMFKEVALTSENPRTSQVEIKRMVRDFFLYARD